MNHENLVSVKHKICQKILEKISALMRVVERFSSNAWLYGDRDVLDSLLIGHLRGHSLQLLRPTLISFCLPSIFLTISC